MNDSFARIHEHCQEDRSFLAWWTSFANKKVVFNESAEILTVYMFCLRFPFIPTIPHPPPSHPDNKSEKRPRLGPVCSWIRAVVITICSFAEDLWREHVE